MPNIFHPKHPERICRGCDRYCPADDLSCGNGTIRTPNPMKLLGDDWCDGTQDTRMADDAPEHLLSTTMLPG
jgi:hypothetical protein